MKPEYIERLVRAMIPWPIAWSILDKNTQKSLKGKKIKIFETELLNIKSNLIPGTLYTTDNKVLISTKSKSIRLKKFQLESKKQTEEKEFLNGIGRELLNY